MQGQRPLGPVTDSQFLSSKGSCRIRCDCIILSRVGTTSCRRYFLWTIRTNMIFMKRAPFFSFLLSSVRKPRVSCRPKCNGKSAVLWAILCEREREREPLSFCFDSVFHRNQLMISLDLVMAFFSVSLTKVVCFFVHPLIIPLTHHFCGEI